MAKVAVLFIILIIIVRKIFFRFKLNENHSLQRQNNKGIKQAIAIKTGIIMDDGSSVEYGSGCFGPLVLRTRKILACTSSEVCFGLEQRKFIILKLKL